MNDNDYVEIDGQKIKIPDIVLGKTIPYGIEKLIMEQERADKAERKARLYFWGGIAASFLCMIGGYLLGKFC